MSLPPEEGAARTRSRARSVLTFAFRLAVGAAVFGFVVVRDPGELLDTVREADVVWVAGAALALIVGLFVSALRWRAYLDALELPLPPGTLVRLYFVGTFFNAFLPTGVGGDAYKAIRLGEVRGSRAPAFASVFLDRFAGVVALALIGLGGVAVELLAGDPDRRVAGVALALSSGVLVASAVLLLGGERLLGKGRLIKEHGIGGGIRRAMRAIHAAARHPRAAARGYALGLVFQGLVLVYHLLLARALHLQGVSGGAMAGVVVISSLATMIPLTVNGLGFREAAYVWALGTFGIARPEARAFAVLVLVILLATSLVGGIVYVAAGGEVER